MKRKLRTALVLVSMVLQSVILFAQEGKANESESLKNFVEKLQKASDPQILDVRSPQEFAENHLQGAINFYVPTDSALSQSIGRLNRKKPVFVYSINNGRSSSVSKKLLAAGFVDVNPLPGGLAAWIGAGYPIVSDKKQGLSKKDYNELTSSDYVVLVDIGSKHCGGCKKLEPVVDEVSKAQGLKVVKVELYDNRELAKDLNIQSVPTLILYKNNKVVWQKSGNISKADIDGALERAL